MFLDDKYPPSAIFLEYIPNMQMIYPEHYTKKRAEALVRGIQEIHKALILHSDAKPRNMMIVGDDPERVVWLDFDRAQTYNPDSITERQRNLIEEEELMVAQFAEFLVSNNQISSIGSH
jgi:serine/threonine protein kinase